MHLKPRTFVPEGTPRPVPLARPRFAVGSALMVGADAYKSAALRYRPGFPEHGVHMLRPDMAMVMNGLAPRHVNILY